MMSISSQTDNGDLESTFKSKTTQLNKLDENIVELKLKLDELTTVLPTTMPTKTAASDPKKWTAPMIARMDPHGRVAEEESNRRNLERQLQLKRSLGLLDNHK